MAALCRRDAVRAAARDAGIPGWSSDIKPVRGRCLRRRCKSRWAVPRVSLDFRDPDRVDRLATLECVSCGRTWRRIPDSTRVRTPGTGYLAARVTLILASTAHRWRSRGRWHREGDDGLVLVNATVAELEDAVDAHRERMDKRADARQRATAKREAEAAADREATREWLARVHEEAAAREAEEAAAAAREARGEA